jgi:hypothetical protein
MAKWNVALARASAVPAVAAAVSGLLGCSSSSSGSGPSDAATAIDFDALPPLGVAEPNCNTKNCPLPAACGGALLGPSTGISYCTLTCSTDKDCPSGTTCLIGKIRQLYGGHCLKSCTADTDCSGGFACDKALSVCWSPYNGADAVPDGGGGGQDGAAETGSTSEGGSDAGTSEASAEAGGD